MYVVCMYIVYKYIHTHPEREKERERERERERETDVTSSPVLSFDHPYRIYTYVCMLYVCI